MRYRRRRVPAQFGIAHRVANQEENEVAKKQAAERSYGEGVPGSNLVWVFSPGGRSGTSWLAAMLKGSLGAALWNEPLVGKMLGEFYFRRLNRTPNFIFGEDYRESWERGIRLLILDGVRARHPEADERFVIMKEPSGTIGAPLLTRALPDSRIVLLIRDPRDIISSVLDGHKEGNWSGRGRRWRTADDDRVPNREPDAMAKRRAHRLMEHANQAREAYESHPGPKFKVTYEDLRGDTLATMRQMLTALDLPINEAKLTDVVSKNTWENIPDEEKGDGKIRRKAKPGGFEEDLTPKQREIIERITAPLLDEFYPGWKTGSSPPEVVSG